METAQLDRRVIDALKANADIPALVAHYGGKLMPMNGNGLRSSCIVHQGSNPSSFTYNEDTGYFACFSCSWQGDALALIQTIEHCSFVEALNTLSQFSDGNGKKVLNGRKYYDDPWLAALEKTYGEKPEQNEVIYSPLVERSLRTKPNPYVTSGKFEEETVDYFEVGYCDFNDYFMNRAIITIHNEEGKLIGFSGRDMTGTCTDHGKYRIKKGFKKGYCLYNLNRAKTHISRSSPLVITEGFGQVWRLLEAGIPTGVALMGKTMTEQQRELVLQHATSVVLALDFDEPGQEATAKLLDFLYGLVDIQVMTSPHGPDVDLGDMNVEQVRECYASVIPDYLWANTVGAEFVVEGLS